MNKIITNPRNGVFKCLLASISLLLCFSGRVYAQNPVAAPLDIPLFLSSNFGELRTDHFHSGLDFKTQGVTGFAVKAVKDGFISRIGVSPTGFGRAVYINHPDGTTSVYGHLDRFAPKIEVVVKDNQYTDESFTVNLYFSAQEFPIKRGEIIAYSGNTGSSGGPHLHFELRDSQTEYPFDPLPVFRKYLKDSRPPEIRSLLFVPQSGEGIVNGNTGKQIVNIIKNKSGKYILSKPIKAWGMIGIGIRAYDKMDAVSNTYGVKDIRLLIDNAEVYHSVIDRFSFDESRYLNSFIDWNEWITNKSFFMKSYIEPGNKLGIYRSGSNGLISIRESKTYSCEYILRDAFGNTSSFQFVIVGEKQSIPKERKDGILFPYNRPNEYRGKGMTLNIPEGSLYTDVYLDPDTVYPGRILSFVGEGGTVFAPVYSFGERMPLHNYCPLTLTVTNDSYPDKRKYGIVSIVNNEINWLGGEYELRKMKTRVRELGLFAVVVDTVPPSVIPQNPTKWTISKRISFKVTDELSGIDFYRGTLNGKFALFEYDAKTNSLFCDFDDKRMEKGKQTLILVVRDKAKNETIVSYDVVF